MAARFAERPKAGRPRISDACAQDVPVGDVPPDVSDSRGSLLLNEVSLHEVYRLCKKAFLVRPGVREIAQMEDPEEAAFCLAVSDFFLQQRQRELVRRGVF